MEQYPDSISVVIAASATQSASGGWTAGATSNFSSDCRVEANTGGRKIVAADGSLTDFAFSVFMPPTTTIIPSDSEYTLTSLLNGVIEGRVKLSFNGQLNSRLWL